MKTRKIFRCFAGLLAVGLVGVLETAVARDGKAKLLAPDELVLSLEKANRNSRGFPIQGKTSYKITGKKGIIVKNLKVVGTGLKGDLFTRVIVDFSCEVKAGRDGKVKNPTLTELIVRPGQKNPSIHHETDQNNGERIPCSRNL